MKETSLLWYRVNLRVSQTMLNHNQTLFFDSFLLLLFVWRVCKSFFKGKSDAYISSHLHSTARAPSNPSGCFQMSTNLDKDFFRCLLR